MLSSILGLFPLEARSTTSSKWDNQKRLHILPNGDWAERDKQPWLKNTTLIIYTKTNQLPNCRWMCHMDALLCCLHMQCPCQQNTLYVKFIKNNVLKLHSCFNLHFVAPSQVQNPSTEVIYKQKNQWWRSRTRKFTQFTFVMILVLKNVAGRVCVPLPAFPVYLHMYTQTGATAAQSRWLPSSSG